MAIVKRLPAAFFRNESGRMPVREWLLSLDDEDRKTIGDDIRTAEFIKKTKKTPVRDLEIAVARQRGLT